MAGRHHAPMSWSRLGGQVRAIRLRSAMRQADVARRAGLSRSVVSLIERGRVERMSVGSVEAVVGALGARVDPRLLWHGPELDRLTDAAHAALSAAVKRRLERWGWLVRVEVSFNHYGDRGRIDLLAWHPIAEVVVVVEIKTGLADVQALLGAMDVKTRIAPRLVAGFGAPARSVVPAIVFLENRTSRRRVASLDGLFSRYELRGRDAIGWARRPTASQATSGLLWFQSLSDSRLSRVSGLRVRKRAAGTLS
jgi:transcriptional regulator with XRE-family HTH domain